MQTFSFKPLINLIEEGKWLLAVGSFQATHSVFNIFDENNKLLISIPGYWSSKSAEKTIDELIKLLGLRSQNDIELQVEEVRKRGNKIKIGGE